MLQHVKSLLDSIHGLGLGGCLACSRSRQLAMPGEMPASAREAEKGATACAVGASWPGSRLLPRLIRPATELARHVPLFPSRLELPSPDKSDAACAGFRERALLRALERVEPDGVEQGFHHVIEGVDRHKVSHHFLIP